MLRQPRARDSGGGPATDGKVSMDVDEEDRPLDLGGSRVTQSIGEALVENASIAFRRDRLLASLVLIAGIGLILATPFALRAGAEFFLPVTAALVIAIALVPLLEWLERRRVPSQLAAFLCVVLFLLVANIAVASIVVPATNWFALLPSRIGQIRHNLSPVLDLYSTAERFINETLKIVARHPATHTRTVQVETPNSLVGIIAASAPFAIIQAFFAILVVFFFLSGWTRMRRRTITSRTSFTSAMTTARVIQEMVDATSAYLATITAINLAVGVFLAAALWAYGMPTPLMWGGIATLLNYIPYLGPIAVALLLALGGLMTYPDAWYAAIPPAIFIGIHLIEANLITPTLVGRRLTVNPLLILVALSFWGWVWGTTGALLAVPLLIILKTILDAAGKPDIAGFLFEEGTLTSAAPEEPVVVAEPRVPPGGSRAA